MTIKDLYSENRYLINDGDFILFSGTGPVARIIKGSDNADYSHIGRVVRLGSRLLIVDSNAKGNHPEWLSTRIESYNEDSYFCILRSNRSKAVIEQNVLNFIIQSDDERTKYDFTNGIKELLNRSFGLKLKLKLTNKYHICSESVRKSAQDLGMMSYEFVSLVIAFPQDYLRHRDKEETTLLLF